MIRDWDSYTLTRRERRIVRALACGLYDPRAGGLATRRLEVSLGQLADDVQAWLGTPHPALRAAFRALLVSIEISPFRFGFGLHTMSSLPRWQLAQYVAALEASSSAALEIWKSILGMAYFARPIGAVQMDLVRAA